MSTILSDDETIRSMMQYFLEEYSSDRLSDSQYYNYLRFLRNHSTDYLTIAQLKYRCMEVMNMHPEIKAMFPGDKV